MGVIPSRVQGRKSPFGSLNALLTGRAAFTLGSTSRNHLVEAVDRHGSVPVVCCCCCQPFDIYVTIIV